MISLKYGNLNKETIEAINKLTTVELESSLAFRLLKIIREVNSAIEDKQKMETRIFEKWAKKDESGNPILIKNDKGEPIPGAYDINNPDEFSKEIEHLQQMPIEIHLEKINFTELGIEKISVKDLLAIEFLLA